MAAAGSGAARATPGGPNNSLVVVNRAIMGLAPAAPPSVGSRGHR